MTQRSGEHILGFDLGASAAVASLGYPMGEFGVEKLTLPKKLDDPAKCARWQDQVNRLLEQEPLAVAYEDAVMNRARGAMQKWIRREEGILLACCASRDILCIGVSSATIRAFARKNGMPKWEKGKVKDALRLGAEGMGWPVEQMSGDEIDAAWVVHWFAEQDFNVSRIA